MYISLPTTTLLATLLTLTAAAPTAAPKLRIMPLGDSITEITCWRPLVWDLLVASNLSNSVEFVGSMTNNPQNCVGKTSTWDKHHEGHSGYLAVNIAANNLQGWLASAKPDVVMFMLGTNDIVQQGKSTSEIVAAYSKMLGLMRSSNANMKIIIDLVIPIGIGSYQSQVNALNKAIPTWVAQQTTKQSPIVIADCATGFTTGMLRDGIHPNAAGDAVIAKAVGPVLVDTVRKALNGTS
ncbi:SGNH hydrolase [Glarea lozoyensis ATCC 20868]|uniref:SGNH hydrolase n=1 Tax=Glarea lozoyensis (strain ATCC 20868 / MF5171) TaxID=1116229 RepID=S3DE26_GLAL2|nr:SGNH hydrolase [Glarea lozoyensis ATCC 20868]EPE24898.1 SGNH hydrolase [Glarea lozoyensis ATCC 20868]